MASDRQQFSRAAQRYHTLLANDELSVPDLPGSTHAILVPYVFYETSDASTSSPSRRNPDIPWHIDEYKYFEAEGYALAEEITKTERTADLRLLAGVSDFREVLRDRSIGALTICGRGNLSSVQVTLPDDEQLAGLPSGRTDGYVRWLDLAHMASHLKRGRVIQRVCGRYSSTLNVPLGWGVASRHRDILAPAGISIYPEDIFDEENEKIQPITELDFLDYDTIKKMFNKRFDRNDHGGFINSIPYAPYVVGRTAYNAFNRLRPPASEQPDEQ